MLSMVSCGAAQRECRSCHWIRFRIWGSWRLESGDKPTNAHRWHKLVLPIYHLRLYLGHALVAAERDMLLIGRLTRVRVDTAFLLRDLRMVLRHCRSINSPVEPVPARDSLLERAQALQYSRRS